MCVIVDSNEYKYEEPINVRNLNKNSNNFPFSDLYI